MKCRIDPECPFRTSSQKEIRQHEKEHVEFLKVRTSQDVADALAFERVRHLAKLARA